MSTTALYYLTVAVLFAALTCGCSENPCRQFCAEQCGGAEYVERVNGNSSLGCTCECGEMP